MTLNATAEIKLMRDMDDAEAILRRRRRSLSNSKDALEMALAKKEVGKRYEPITSIETRIRLLKDEIGKLERSLVLMRQKAMRSWE